MENVYSSKENRRLLPYGSSAVEQSPQKSSLYHRGTFLGRALRVIAAAFLATALGALSAAADVVARFYYDFGAGTGSVLSQDPVASAVSFSGLSLHNVTQGGYIPGLGTTFGPWPTDLAPGWPNNPSDPYLSFTVFAPNGYDVDVARASLAAPTIQGGDRFSVSGPGPSEEIKVGFVHSPPVGDQLPLSSASGQLTVVPEPSTVLGGIAAVGLILIFFVRRLTRGRTATALA